MLCKSVHLSFVPARFLGYGQSGFVIPCRSKYSLRIANIYLILLIFKCVSYTYSVSFLLNNKFLNVEIISFSLSFVRSIIK